MSSELPLICMRPIRFEDGDVGGTGGYQQSLPESIVYNQADNRGHIDSLIVKLFGLSEPLESGWAQVSLGIAHY